MNCEFWVVLLGRERVCLLSVFGCLQGANRTSLAAFGRLRTPVGRRIVQWIRNLFFRILDDYFRWFNLFFNLIIFVTTSSRLNPHIQLTVKILSKSLHSYKGAYSLRTDAFCSALFSNQSLVVGQLLLPATLAMAEIRRPHGRRLTSKLAAIYFSSISIISFLISSVSISALCHCDFPQNFLVFALKFSKFCKNFVTFMHRPRSDRRARRLDWRWLPSSDCRPRSRLKKRRT